MRKVATGLIGKVDGLIHVWEGLGDRGPTLGSAAAGESNVARMRYLYPLAKLLIGGLAGSTDHAAVYLDERLRYVDTTSAPTPGRAQLEAALELESAAISALLSDSIAPADVKKAWNGFHAPIVRKMQSTLKLLLIGDCVFVETRAFLMHLLYLRGQHVDVRHVFFSAKQHREAVNTAIINEVAAYKPDLIGISLYTFEGVPPYRSAWRSVAAPSSRRRTLSLVNNLVGLLDSTIEDIRTVTDATVIVHTPGGIPLDPVRRRLPFVKEHSRGQDALLSGMKNSIGELTRGVVNTLLLDECDAITRAGGLRSASQALFDPSDVPPGYSHTTKLGPYLAAHYESIIEDFEQFRHVKALLVDFDNTLWEGVMAEGPVCHHRDRQDLLLELKEAGILLVALSKNDPTAIRWEEMTLSEEDFVITKINWDAKPANTAAAIAELDLAPSAFVLVDDNPVELALVTERVAGVKALDARVCASWDTLRNLLAFPATRQTEESRRRTSMYQEAMARRASLATVNDYPEMMRSLKLRHSVRIARKGDTDRLVELMQRTNQFNTTTRRRTVTQIRELLAREDAGTYVATLADRFGELGVVAAAVFERNTRTFDSVIMSCRAMGFGLEFALLRQVMDAEGDGVVRGEFIESERNRPAADLFERAGFQDCGDGFWELQRDGTKPSVPEWFR